MAVHHYCLSELHLTELIATYSIFDTILLVEKIIKSLAFWCVIHPISKHYAHEISSNSK